MSFFVGTAVSWLSYEKLLTLAAILVVAVFSAGANAQANLGSVKIGSSKTAAATVSFLSAGKLEGISVVTQGAPGLDFTNAGGGTCTVGTAYAAKATCTVKVSFSPRRSGTRYGAAVLTDADKNVLATAYLQGNGQGPQTVFAPGTQTAIGHGFFDVLSVAADGNGNVYISDYDWKTSSLGHVYKETPSGSGFVQAMILSGLGSPSALAVDGSGNVYGVDENLGLFKETLSNGSYTQTAFGSGFECPFGLAVDGSGNVYVADSCKSAVYKEVLSNGGYTQTGIASGLGTPRGVAVDGSGNVFVADVQANAVYKLAPAKGGYTKTTIGSGFVEPQGVAVDGNGNVYITDENAVYKETLSDGSYTQSTIPGIEGNLVAVDGSGNAYFASQSDSSVYKDDFADPPALNFASTFGGTTSSDSPKTVTVSNFGNAALKFSDLVYPKDFPESAGDASDCRPNTSLAPDENCTLTIDFLPVASVAAGKSVALKESVTLTTDTLNASATEQAVSATGTESKATVTVALSSLSGPSSPLGEGVYFEAHLTPVASGPEPSGSVTLYSGTSVLGTAPVSNEFADLTLSSLPIGSHSIVAVYSGDSVYGKTTSNSVTETITKANSWVTLAVSANPTTAGSPVTFTSQVTSMNGLATPTGTVTFNSGKTALGKGTLKSGVATYSTSSLPVGTFSITATYSGDAVHVGSTSYAAVTESIVAAPGTLPFGDVHIGTVNIGSSSSAIPLTVTFEAAETLGSIAVLTQGAPGLDFTNAGGGTCAVGTAYAAKASCTVKVIFRPRYAGTRFGAVALRDKNGNLIGTGLLQGTGQGPQAVFMPGMQSTVASGFGFGGSLAVDGAGNVYVAEVNDMNGDGFVYKETLQSTGSYAQTSIGSGFTNPSVAVDSIGNVYVADEYADTVYKLAPAQSGYTQTTIGSGFSDIGGVAVDGSGNVYVTDEATLYKETLSNGSYLQTTIDSTFSEPFGVAVDGTGNVYVADADSAVYKETLSNGKYARTKLATGLGEPLDVAVDGTGNVYVTDAMAGTVYKETLQSNGSYTQTAIASGFGYPNGIAVDGSGNVYVADQSDVFKEDFADPPTMSFATTVEGATSKDSPQTETVSNLGNTPLKVSAVSYPVDFPEIGTATGACKSGTSLATGGTCTLTTAFSPVAALGNDISQVLNENLTIATNTLNKVSTEQSLLASGREIGRGTGKETAPPAFSLPPGTYVSEQTVAMFDTTSGATIYYTTSGTTPTTASTKYSGAITVGKTETIEAIAVSTGHSQSAVATAMYQIAPAATAPTFSPSPGTYPSAQKVIIKDATAGATIYYTINGVPPTTSSTVYTGPITVSSSQTLVAIAVAPGYSISAAVPAQYLISSSATSLIYTIAGNQHNGYSGDGGLATGADLNYPGGTAVDRAGNLYIADTGNSRIRKVVRSTGVITTFAGTGTPGYSGDNAEATSAELNSPAGLAFDSAGNLYISDSGNNVIRKVTATTGKITTFAGNGTCAYLGDGSSATNANLCGPEGLAFDSAGNLYIADSENNVIRKIAAKSLIIATIAGNGTPGFEGDGGAATAAELRYPQSVALDSANNVYIADLYNNVVRKVSASSGIITPIAGSSFVYSGGERSFAGYSGDGGSATQAELDGPASVALDSAGNLYINDRFNSVVRKVTASNGIITTAVGNPSECSAYGGDGGPVTSAGLCYPNSMALDSAGNLYVSDGTSRIREVIASSAVPSKPAATPVFSVPGGTYAGTQSVAIADSAPGAAIYVTLDGTTPTSASQGYNGRINATGTVTIKAIAIAPGYLQSAVATAAYTITSLPAAVITTVAGNGIHGYSGDGGAALSAELGNTIDVALDASGDFYILDQDYGVVRKVSGKTGVITTVVGTGTAGYTGDGGPASDATLNNPQSVALDRSGNLYVADSQNNVIRKVMATTGIITTVAGNGSSGYSGDGGAATKAELSWPQGIALDSSGNLYIADSQNNVIRKVTATTGTITTVAGNGTRGYRGDGGLAASAELNSPKGLVVDSAGNLYIADGGNARVRKVAAGNKVITTVAGNGDSGNSGDGGPATKAEINPQGVALDSAGTLYIASGSSAVRMVSAKTGVIATVAGSGFWGFSGDGGSATVAELDYPAGIALDSVGSLYIADDTTRIRKVKFSPVVATPVFSVAAGTYTSTLTVKITDATAGATIYYTTNGTAPTTNSSKYTGAVKVSASETLEAIAVAASYSESAVATAKYNLVVATPTFTPGQGAYSATQSVTIKDTTSGAVIYYTTNGDTPTTNSTKYSTAISVAKSETLKAIAVATGYTNSSVVAAVYTIK